MRIFDFFKKQIKSVFPIKEKLKILIENIPEHYYSERQYKNCVEFYENNEYGLTLESLVELCEETNHYFSIDYWKSINEIAEQLNLNLITKYCGNQIERNEKEINWKMPLGFTTNKVDETHFETFISKKLLNNWDAKRRKEDDVKSLVDKNGIHYKPKGRNGHFYAVENGKISEIEYEIDLNGLLLFFRNTNTWFYPTEIKLDTEEKNKIKAQIEEWSRKTKNKLLFD